MTSEKAIISEKLKAAPLKWQLYPGLGFVSVWVGTLLAIAFIPNNIQDVGALRISGICMTLGLLIVPIRVFFNNPIAAFHPLILLTAAPVYWLLLDLLQDSYGMRSVGKGDVQIAFLAIGLFCSMAWLAGFFKPMALPKIIQDSCDLSISNNAMTGIGIFAFGVAFLKFAIPSGFDPYLMAKAFTEGRWSTPWARGILGGWNAFLDHLSYFGYILPPITAYLIRSCGWFNWRSIMLIICSLIFVLLSSADGGRRIVGVLLGGGMIVWFLCARKPKTKDIIMLAVGAAAILAFMQFMVVYRLVGYTQALSKETRMEGFGYLHVDDNFLKLTETVSIIPDKHDHVGMEWVIYVLIRPIPRVVWPSKPMTPGFDIAQYQGVENTQFTISLIGELYMAFNLFGCVFGGLAMGWLAMAMSEILKKDVRRPGALVVFSSGVFMLFLGMRSGIELVLTSYGAIIWIVLSGGYALAFKK